MAMPKEWLEFLREQFPKGSRIKLETPREWAEPRLLGTLKRIDDDGVFHMQPDYGPKLPLKLGEDRFTLYLAPLQRTREAVGERIRASPAETLADALLEEACRQWFDFIQENPERGDGAGFADFHREICEMYGEDPDLLAVFGQESGEKIEESQFEGPRF